MIPRGNVLTYTLMDLDTGNLIGTYATEREALSLIQSAIATFGVDYADTVALGREDAAGHTKIIAEGQELAKRAMAATLS